MANSETEQDKNGTTSCLTDGGLFACDEIGMCTLISCKSEMCCESAGRADATFLSGAVTGDYSSSP
jgi:hypothetical protein